MSKRRAFPLLAAATVAAAMALGAVRTASAQSVTFDFQDGTDQGWGGPFGADADITFAVDNVGGSLRMKVPNTSGFQEAAESEGNTATPFFQAMAAAAANPSGYALSYDWYLDTTQVTGATFFQIGSYVNTGSGYYAQNFPGTNKEVELNGTQLTSGQVFSGTVTVPFDTYRNGSNATMPTGETFYRLGLIENADSGAVAPVYFDNIRIAPVPEPASVAALGLVGMGVLTRRRRQA